MRALAASLLAAASCSVGPPRAVPPPAAPDPAPIPPTESAVEDVLLREATRTRDRAGLPPLRRQEALDAAARSHARELARRHVLDHTSEVPDRRTLAQRLHLAGVTRWLRIGENLAQIPSPLIDPGREAIQLWLGSPGHRANLLEPTFDRAGAGVTRSADGTWWIVQVYGSGILPDTAGRPRP